MNSGPIDPFELFSWAVAAIFLLAGILIVVNVLWLLGKAIFWLFKKRPADQVVPEPETPSDRGADGDGQGHP